MMSDPLRSITCELASPKLSFLHYEIRSCISLAKLKQPELTWEGCLVQSGSSLIVFSDLARRGQPWADGFGKKQ